VDTFVTEYLMSMDAKTKKQKQVRKRHSDEFKAGAVALVLREGRTVASVASDLDIAGSVLHGWVRQARIDGGQGGSGRTTSDKEEVARLLKENRILKMERDILKKAAAFFAKESA
jgi:transposase